MKPIKLTVKPLVCAVVVLVFLIPLGSLFASSGEAVPVSAQGIFNCVGQKITDTVLTGWLVSALIIVVIRLLLRGGPRTIPTHGQAFLEGILSALRSLMEPIIGKRVFGYVFPMLIGFFFFILVNNLSGLFPGIGSIAVMDHGHPRFLIRPANSDLNTTLALALAAFFGWGYSVFRYSGPRVVFHEIFGNKAEKSEISKMVYSLLFLVFFAVGFIECLSILFRIVSLSFRLYGNVFGGENLLHHMVAFSEKLQQYSIVKYFSFMLPLPFYLLEFLVGIIQASVFTLLVSVYIGLVSNHDEEHAPIGSNLTKGNICLES